MSLISANEYETVVDCVARLYEVERLELFPAAALTQILRLVQADSSTFNYVAPMVPKVTTVAIPEIPDEIEKTARFSTYLPQHAALNYFLETGNPEAVKLSDFQSVREYHRLPLYQEFYRELDYEDQFTFMLFPPGSELIGLSLARSNRSFTEKDREILNLLRVHIARAYRHVERTGLMLRGLDSSAGAASGARVCSILLDSTGRPTHYPREAQNWIERFFGPLANNCKCLPDVIRDWLSALSKPNTSSLHQHSERMLVREKENERLRLKVLPASDKRNRLLLLAVETIPYSAQLSRHGLTARELQVLTEVEKGKSNGEVSAALGISPLTVRCHLEHIFAKLKVASRTAAVTQLRHIMGLEQPGIQTESARSTME